MGSGIGKRWGGQNGESDGKLGGLQVVGEREKDSDGQCRGLNI